MLQAAPGGDREIAVARIFLSYASQDRRQAKPIAEALASQGWSVWWDQDIPAGRRFDEVISNELHASECVVVLWSSSSVNSDWVKEEATEAAARRILVPVLLEDVSIPLGFRRIQAARLIGWDGTAAAAEFVVLRDAVALCLQHGRETRPADGPQRATEETRGPVPNAARASPKPVAAKPDRLRPKTVAILAVVVVAMLGAFSITYFSDGTEPGNGVGQIPAPLGVREIEARLKNANIELSTGADADKARVRGYFTGPDAAYYLLAINCLQLLRNSRLKETNHLDMIDKWYTSLVGSGNYVERDGLLDHEKLRSAIVMANNEYHGQSATSFEQILQPKE